MSSVGFVALFEPCFGQHLKKTRTQFGVPTWPNVLPKQGSLKNQDQVNFIENMNPFIMKQNITQESSRN